MSQLLTRMSDEQKYSCGQISKIDSKADLRSVCWIGAAEPGEVCVCVGQTSFSGVIL